MKFNKKLGAAVIVVLFCFSFLPVFTPHTAKAQSSSSVLFSDDFDTNQPNSHFVLGAYDSLNSTTYVSPTHSLQVSGESSNGNEPGTNSYATFSATTGQIYIQLFFMSPNDGAGVNNWVIELTGNNGNTWFELRQDSEDGLEFYIGDNTYSTNVFLTPNAWQNITLSLYLDPSHGTGSYASLWLDSQEVITNQNMPQVTGYAIDTIIFLTPYEKLTNYYDNIIITSQPSYSPSPTPTPAPTSTPINTTPTPKSTSTSSPKSTLTPTPIPTRTATPAATAAGFVFSAVDWLIVIIVIIIVLILMILALYRRRRKPKTQQTQATYLGTF